MEAKVHAEIEAHEILEITPVSVMRAATRLKIKAVMDRHQVADFMIKLIDDLGFDGINEALKQQGYELKDYRV